jgi:alanine dehydrogenase
MIIGIPKEVKEYEFRVGATPSMVFSLVAAGHIVFVQTGAGEKVGFSDHDYLQAGAKIAADAKQVFTAEMIIKVKEPQAQEFELLKEGQILFCYLHLAPDPVQTKALLEKKVVGIAYETVTDSFGNLPLLVPMSEIAGRVAIQAGANALQMNHGGKGVLLGGVPGVHPANVVIIGGGVVGTEAARMALGLGANVKILDTNLNRLRKLDALWGPHLKTLFSTPYEIETCIRSADLLIGSVLIAGKLAPKLVTRKFLSQMEKGSVFVDVAIDQGGCSETSRPTTHGKPTYVEEGVIHYCVTNMPGAFAKTATVALTNATCRYALMLANKGYRQAFREDPGLQNGLNVCLGHVTNLAVAHDLNLPYTEAAEMV